MEDALCRDAGIVSWMEGWKGAVNGRVEWKKVVECGWKKVVECVEMKRGGLRDGGGMRI